MLVRLRNYMKQPNLYQLAKLGLIDSHQSLSLPAIVDYYEGLSASKKTQLIQDLISSIPNNTWIWEMKIYMIIHELLLKTQSAEIQEKFLMLQFKPSPPTIQQDLKVWIRNTITKQYHYYITKLCLDLDLINSCDAKQISVSIKSQFMNEINQSFRALNLMVEIIQTQTNFSKMGRYYPEYLVIFDLFKKYLVDIKKYYQRIKYTITYVLDNYTVLSNQELTHGFYFLNEALVTSDRQYEFFYNRYFYEKMKQFSYPSFYQLDYEKHNKMIRYIKKRGLELEYTNNDQVRPRNKSKDGNRVRGLKSKTNTNMNKTMDCTETTAVTIHDNCKTMADYGFNKYDEVYNI